MNKGLLGKVSLFSVILLAIALILIFVLPVFSIPFVSTETPSNLNAGATNQILNFTIINANATGDITQVNITLPSGFGFIAVSNATTATNTDFSNTSNKVVWTNTTEAGFVSGGSTQYFSINVSVPLVASATYNFNVSTLDNSGNYNSTNVTITVNDTSFPTWSGQSNVTPSTYSSTPSQFNISWTDDVGVTTVLIEGNWSNSNDSMTNEYGDGIYNYSAIIPAGVWQWKSYASDTKGNTNVSSTIIIYIAQATPSMTLTNATVTYPTSTAVNGSVVTGDPAGKYNISLYRNDSLKNSSTTAGFTFESVTLGAGLWDYTLVYNGTQNYTYTSITNFTVVSQNSSNPVKITISNGTALDDQNFSTTYGTSITTNCSNVYSGSGSCLLYRDSSSVGTSETVTLGAGTYNYTVVTLGNTNYGPNATGETFYLTVGKKTLSISLSVPNITYPSNTVATASETNTGDADVNYTLYLNSSGLVNYSLGNGNISQTILLGVGNYIYTLNTTSATFANYTANTTGISAAVNVSKGTASLNVYIDGNASNETIAYPSVANISANESMSGDSDCVYTLWRNVTQLVNGSDVWNYTQLGYGTYGPFKYNMSGTCSNWTLGSSSSYYLFVNKGYLTGSITGSGVTYPAYVNVIPSASNVGDDDVNYTFWRSESLFSFSSTLGLNPSADTSQIAAGTYTYKLNSSGGTNWTSNSSISTLVIVVSAAPSTTTTTGSSTGGITTTGMVTYINLAVGKANITANYITTGGKLIANIARYQDVAIRGLNVTVVNNVANIKIMISKLPSLPSNVPYDINGKVYNYISTSEQNFTDADIKSVNISFAVNKTWLTNNNIDASNITLYRWANNKWNDLSASKISEDANEVFFRVSSPGLSVFIIGTKGGAPAVTEPPATCTESWTCTDWSTCTNSQQTKTCTDSNNCGTTTSKPSESQSCTVSKGETTVPSPVPTSILTTIIVVVIALIACVFIFLQRAKISSYLTTVTKKSGNHKKTSYLESLARKVNKVEEEEEEKFNVRTE